MVPTHQALMTIESTDPAAFWVPSYLETLLLRVWYPVTVATISWHARQTIAAFLQQTSDDPQAAAVQLLTSARAVSRAWNRPRWAVPRTWSTSSAPIPYRPCAWRAHYHAPMAGYSIPAAEHSTITSWGREREVDAYRNMLRQFGTPGAIVAVVSDSYDIYRAISEHWGTTLRDEVIASGATLVIRPDSGTRWRWWPKACAGWMKRSATASTARATACSTTCG